MTKLSEMTMSISTAAVGVIIAVFTWFVRTVLTNNKRIDLLEQRQTLQHEEMSSAVSAVRDAVRALEAVNETTTANQLEITLLVQEMRRNRE